VQSNTDVTNLNKNFPVAASSTWADTSNPRRLKILVDDSDQNVIIPAGMYKFQFPILFPPVIPPENIWYLALCSDRSCYDIETDKQIIITTFPIPGFSEGQESPFSLRPSGAAGRFVGVVASMMAAWAVALLF